MLVVSHRGNLSGQDKDLENSPLQILEALSQGFDVEIDVWREDCNWWLGHDEPKYKVTEDFLRMPRLWLHAKDIKTISKLSNIEFRDLHYFFHQNDDICITSRLNVLWTFPGKQLLTNSIAVCPERVNWEWIGLANCFGICTDFPIQCKEKYKVYGL